MPLHERHDPVIVTPPFDSALLDRRIDWEDRRSSNRTGETEFAPPERPSVFTQAEQELFCCADLVETLLGGFSDDGVSGPPDLPGFVLISRLGGGGMGEVWLGTDLTLDRPVAIKFPHRRLTGDAFARRFARERRALARHDHPNIVRVFEAGEVGEFPYLVMEYVAGGTLDDRLDEARENPLRAAGWIASAAHAVQHAHTHKVIHRDLKPSNLLLTADGTVKVVDFGVAAFLADWDDELHLSLPSTETPLSLARLTRTDVVIGTPPYAAPEAYRSTTARPESDIWSLGVILYLATTGKLPFDGKFDAIRHAVLATEPVSPRSHAPAIPHWLDAIILRCLAKNPAARFPSAGALAEALEVGIARHRQAVARRGRFLRLAVGATAAALVMALMVTAVSSDSPERRYAQASAVAVKSLSTGQAVKLVNPNQPPVALAVVNPNFVTAGRDDEGNPTFDVTGRAMIEFLPAVPISDFRITAALRQTHANGNTPHVALFACGTTGRSDSRDCVLLQATDFGQSVATAFAQLRGLRYTPDGARAGGIWEGFAAPHNIIRCKADSNWRQFEMTVTGGIVHARLDGVILPPESLAGSQQFSPRNYFPLRLESIGSIGLFIENCKVAVRDLTLTPLTQDERTR